MRTSLFVTAVLAVGIGLTGCGGAGGENPGRAYMPDMYYSRAYEAYGYNMVSGEHDSLRARGIRYTAMPVPGTVARGEILPYHISGDSAGLAKAEASLRNPFDTVATGAATPARVMAEGERLYLIHCGICHGTKLDGNGPLFNGGNGAYPAAPRTLIDEQAKAWPDGHYFHVITYGIRQMGSYASQVKPEQRWWIINYIRSKQGGTPTSDSAAATPLNQVPGGNADSTNQMNNGKQK
jgi:mono/diheme cytochrome c family protein